MGGFGHIQAMINTMKANKALVRKRTPYGKAKRYDGKVSKRIEAKPLTVAQKQELYERIATRKTRQKKKMIYTAVATLVLLLVFGFIVQYLFVYMYNN